MTPAEFVKKWAASKGSERQTAQEHFIDICRLLGEQTPNEADPSGSFYAFEKGAKTLAGDGFADVWQKNYFAIEYKGKHKDLREAYKQVQRYREALGNPPLLIVSDIERFEVHTNWTNTETWVYHFNNGQIGSDEPALVLTGTGLPAKGTPVLTAMQVLKAIFEDTERLKPQRTTAQITEQAARLFGEISEVLRKYKVDDMRVARFITKVMFCMFATDVRLLPRETFSDVIAVHKKSGDNQAFRKHLANLFQVMNKGGEFSMRHVPFFNGRLFEDDDVPNEITTQEILILGELDELDWTDVEPAIFGTLFVRILDPAQRKKLGAVYTGRADIELIVEPVLMSPLRKEWRDIKQEAEELLDGGRGAAKNAATKLGQFHAKLAAIRVLDPACGSGNFLYVALALLKALEKEVIAFAEMNGIELTPAVHPRQLHGIEVNPYAHELASIVIWIGYLQWKHRNVLPLDDESPILQPLDQIQHMDAVLTSKGKKPVEPEWPKADVIVGNPPFVGGKKMRTALGDEYVDRLFAVWEDRVAREADFVCYWFEKARAAIEAGRTKRVGLLATQAIRGGKNRQVLERIKQTGDIFYAQADRKWIQDGVAVRVSMVGFDDGSETQRLLNQAADDNPEHALLRAKPVPEINANLTGQSDLTKARRLKENVNISFMGDTKVGPFDIPEVVARRFLEQPNPHGKPNSDVVRPWVNGLDITRRPRSMWIIDFPPGMSEKDAAKYQAPFEYIKKNVKAYRAEARSGDMTGVAWWIHQRPRPAMREALAGLKRYLATPNLTKYRFFVWLDPVVLADHQLIVFAYDDDYFLGVLQSRSHVTWALAKGTQLENRPRYTPTTCFETFPFPEPHPAVRDAVAEAAKELNELREGWLNPKSEGLGLAPSELRKRTLTNLYNERPTWLENAHEALDAVVFEAYGWPERPRDLADAEILARLLALNLEREPVD